MEELIFFVVIIFFSIVESIARSRKKRMGAPAPEQPGERQWEEPEQPRRREPPSYDTPPAYDADPSFDAAPSREESSREEIGPRRSQSSESMIPADIWDEIAGLAKESQPKQKAPAPQPRRAPPPLPQRARTTKPRPVPTPMPRPVPTLKPRQAPPTTPKRVTILASEPALEGSAAHLVHVSHADYGTDPSGRARSAHDGLDPLARALSPDAAAVRLQLRGDAHALRQAVILREVLGPPAALRRDRFSDPE